MFQSQETESSQTSPGQHPTLKDNQPQGKHTWGWLVICCILTTLIVCMFSFVGTFGLLPERALASGESMLIADYSYWQDYEPINLDVIGLATAAALGNAPWEILDAVTLVPPATVVQITSQASPLPSATPTEVVPTRIADLPRVTNTLPPTVSGSTATATFTNPPPPPPPTSPPPTSLPPATNTPPPTATNTPISTSTETNTPTATNTATFTPTPTNTPTATSTSTPTQIPPPPEVNVNQPPDGTWLELCSTPLIVDLGSHPITLPGSSLVYYERYFAGPPPCVHLDMSMVEVCPDAACNTAYEVFRWGDGNSSNNGSIPPAYYPPEIAAVLIPAAEMYNNSGILLGLGGVPAGVYRFVRFSAPPNSNCGSDPMANMQVDAVQVIP